jgi:putative FmdB family regulatory protein
MPTYDYRCPNGHTFELFQRMSDAPPNACEVCGASPVERVLYAPAVHFKGSGFYATDYGRGKKRETGSEGEGGSSDKKAGDSKSTDTKTSTSTASSSDGSSTSGGSSGGGGSSNGAGPSSSD